LDLSYSCGPVTGCFEGTTGGCVLQNQLLAFQDGGGGGVGGGGVKRWIWK